MKGIERLTVVLEGQDEPVSLEPDGDLDSAGLPDAAVPDDVRHELFKSELRTLACAVAHARLGDDPTKIRGRPLEFSPPSCAEG